MPTMYERIKAFGEAREQELFGSQTQEEHTNRKRSYIALRSAIDPKFRERALNEGGLESGVETSLRGGLAIPPLQELLTTKDASLLFPKAMQDTIIQPKEPDMIGIDVLAQEISINGSGSSIEWLSTDAIVAHFVDEAEGAPDDQLSFTRHMASTRIRKAMAQIAITEEMVADSQYDLIGLHLEAIGNALRRKKEEWLWTTANNNAQVVFDNGGGTSWKGSTTGVNSSGAANQTFTHLDFVDLLVGPVVHNFTPDWVIAHPLHFPSFVKDPILKELWQNMWPVGMSLPSEDAVRRNLPFAINVALSPFVPTNAKTRDNASSAITGSIFALQKSEALLLITREGVTVKEWTDPRVDVYRTNARERYGVACRNQGKAIAVAKGVSTDANYGPVSLQKTVS